MNWIMQQSMIIIAGIMVNIVLIVLAVTIKSTILIIATAIISFIVGAAISELGQKGKDMGIIK